MSTDWRSAVSHRATIPHDLPSHLVRCLNWWWTDKEGQQIDLIELGQDALTVATTQYIDMNHPMQFHYLQIVRWWDLIGDEDEESGQNDQAYQIGPTEYHEVVIEAGGPIDQSHDYLARRG